MLIVSINLPPVFRGSMLDCIQFLTSRVISANNNSFLHTFLFPRMSTGFKIFLCTSVDKLPSIRRGGSPGWLKTYKKAVCINAPVRSYATWRFTQTVIFNKETNALSCKKLQYADFSIFQISAEAVQLRNLPNPAGRSSKKNPSCLRPRLQELLPAECLA